MGTLSHWSNVPFIMHGPNEMCELSVGQMVLNISPEVVIVPDKVRVLRDPELDGVGLPVKVDQSKTADQAHGQGGQDHEDWISGAKFSMAKSKIKQHRYS